MDPSGAYNPTADYGTAYDAIQRRIGQTYARQLGDQQQGLAARGVATSGVATIPEENIYREKAGALNSAAGQLALEQAHTGIEDRHRAEDFSHQKQLMQYQSDLQEAVNRRQASNMLGGQLLSGGIGALGTVLGGPLGGAIASKLAPMAVSAVAK